MQKDDNCPITRSRLNHVTSSLFALLGKIMTLWTLMGNFLFVDPYIKWRVTQVCIYSLIKHHISPGTSCQLSYTLSVQLSQRNCRKGYFWDHASMRTCNCERLTNHKTFCVLSIETDKEMYRQELLNQPMRVKIAGLPRTVTISLSE